MKGIEGTGMSKKQGLLIFLFAFLANILLFSQTHLAIPLGDPIYYILEQAQLRGLYRFLPTVKPYSRAMVLSIVEEILKNNETRRFGNLSEQERAILEQYQKALNPARDGLNLLNGVYAMEHTWKDVYFSGELGLSLNLGFSGAYFLKAGGYFYDGNPEEEFFEGAVHPSSGDFFFGLDSGFDISWKGDLGRNSSYGLTLGGVFLKTPRAILGITNTYSPGWESARPDDPAHTNRTPVVYSEPFTYFPFTYKQSWDGSVWNIGHINADGFLGWPQKLSFGFHMLPEMGGALLNGQILWRLSRQDREWGGLTGNSSLILNQSAQPFFAGEISFIPFPWISFSAITGVLEHGIDLQTGQGGTKDSASVSQNIFSANVLEVNIINYFHISLGSATIWPKRFELGYLFPLADTFLYQQSLGDFDNSAFFLNLMGQYPGLVKLWGSFFADEMNPGDFGRDFFKLSRMMYAFQFGGSFYIPWFDRLGFNSLTFSYTKIEPYTYTHTREKTPWYGDLAMETNYVNRGRALGHYLPPNSDEFLVRLELMPSFSSIISLQYQLIRTGAEYGDRAVGGSSIWSELDPWRRGNIFKYFLKDGAYQWMHIAKVKWDYSLARYNVPVRFFAEAGVVCSYFTDIDGPVNADPMPYSKVNNNPAYPNSLSFIGVLGISIFPK